ncbi:MAG: hypothetical protein GX977_14670 [Firmicutes bacterium]|nr:hypothetical protein [Bacillota bacterium]
MTKPDKSGQLTIQQENAIGLLMQGQNDRETAEAVGVARQTVTTWRNENPDFIAELNRQRQEVWSANLDQLRQLVGKAVTVLAEDLEGEDKALRQRAAVHTLRAVGLYGADLSPGGATDSEAVELEQKRQGHERMMEHLLYSAS